MIWSRAILDGLALCAVFNLTVALLWLIIPNAFSRMLPPEIRKAAPPREKREVIKLAAVLYPLYIVIFAYMAGSARQAGVSGFWNLFRMGYIEMLFVNFGDLIGLDYLFRKKFLNRIMIKGTEHCRAWETKEWMLKLGLPEHLILWPLIVCPLAGLICAGIGALI